MSSQGLSITVTDVPPTGQTASFAPITSTFQLTSGPNLVVAPTPASASGHTEDVTYVVYDTPPMSGAFPGTAKALGWALTSGLVIHPGKNTNNVVLSGVVDSFAPPLAQSGSFGMMGPSPPTLLGTQTTLGFGAATPANGIATMFDAGMPPNNNITTAAGGPWPVIGAVPTSATASSPGVPVSVVETAGTCGAVGVAPHLELSFNGGAVAPTSAIARTDGALRVIYDGDGGVGWSAVVSAKGVTQTLTYTLSSLGATSTSADFNCANQTLSFSHSNESAVVTIVQPTAATPYTITVPSTANCQQLVDVYNGNSTAAPMMIPYATPTVLTASTFTIQLISSPPAAAMCPIEIQDANAVAAAT